ncbi:MAG: DNA-binding NtrC family response regulator [Flavobacteriales bacterium]|jgi:DNA-binding NtrC family response regulator
MTTQEIKQRFGVIGGSPLLDRAIDKAVQVAPTDISVLITGESGTGKEVMPKIIHHLSVRKHNPYIAVNCGAIPEGTIDSELFGHEKGSFTGATGSRSGYFEEADGGTIFLDEVGELPLATQVRLLRVLETGEFIKVGSSKVIKTNVRIVAATNVDLLEAIEQKQFREDLYYRLNTVHIAIPALRNRKEDVYLLFRKFAADFADKYRVPTIRLDNGAIKLLSDYRWPGNIRQLKNFAEQMSVLEENREISDAKLAQYLPEINNSRVPALLNQTSAQSQFSTERDILYKFLFDMKGDLNDLKKLTHALMKNDSGSLERIQESQPELIRKVYQDFTSNASKDGLLDLNPEAILEDKEMPELDLDLPPKTLEDTEISMIKDALERHRGKRKDAAEELGISERTLYRKIKQYDL